MFGFLKNVVNGLKGNNDFLEGVCAVGALVASADGSIDEKEIQAAVGAIQASKRITDNFTPQEVNTCMLQMQARLKGGSVGRQELWREVTEVANLKNHDMSQTLLFVGIDVAKAEGDIGEQERAVLGRVAELTGQSLDEALKMAL